MTLQLSAGHFDATALIECAIIMILYPIFMVRP